MKDLTDEEKQQLAVMVTEEFRAGIHKLIAVLGLKDTAQALREIADTLDKLAD